MHIAIIGAGWAGMAAALQWVQAGHRVTVLEAARSAGGRARALPCTLPDGTALALDNGQHILIGAYSESLRWMRIAGVDVDAALLRLPLTLRYPDGSGLQLPNAPAPWNALRGILGARGWSLADKYSLLRTAHSWQSADFTCEPRTSVAALCAPLTARLRETFIEPLCVAALNTPIAQASGQVFLRVLQDSLFGPRGSSDLLLPRQDMGRLFPEAAAHWLGQRGMAVHTGRRVQSLAQGADAASWQVDGQPFDAVLLATASSEAARLVSQCAQTAPAALIVPLCDWAGQAQALHYEAITTVYLQTTPGAAGRTLAQPMLALRSSAQAPAQFAFDRGQLGGPPGLLALVASACQGERQALEQQVLAQARSQLGLHRVQALQTVVEKRATFACTPGLQRPPSFIAPGLWACGDYIAGPYPATLEGAVRSGVNTALSMASPPSP